MGDLCRVMKTAVKICKDMSPNVTPTMFCCYGASLDFLSFLQKDLNFEAYIYFTPDGKYGVYNSSAGEWNGIVQELISGRAMFHQRWV